MRKIRQEEIYLKGSKKHIIRTLYTQDDRFFIKWYGEFIEVELNQFLNWRTVEAY